MNGVLLHLIFVLSGVAVAVVGLLWFGIVRGGWLSYVGLIAIGFQVVAVTLILAGFGVVPFPGLENVQ